MSSKGRGEEYRGFSWAKRERERERMGGEAEAQSVCGHNEAVDMMDEEEGNATMVPGPWEGERERGRWRERGGGQAVSPSSTAIQGMLSLSDPHTLSVISTPHHLKHTRPTRCMHDGICCII